jgi:hypothetical protein
MSQPIVAGSLVYRVSSRHLERVFRLLNFTRGMTSVGDHEMGNDTNQPNRPMTYAELERWLAQEVDEYDDGPEQAPAWAKRVLMRIRKELIVSATDD